MTLFTLITLIDAKARDDVVVSGSTQPPCWSRRSGECECMLYGLNGGLSNKLASIQIQFHVLRSFHTLVAVENSAHVPYSNPRIQTFLTAMVELRTCTGYWFALIREFPCSDHFMTYL